MYSRAPRKFFDPTLEKANPSLGPGCYTADDSVLLSGKMIGGEGYAPFSSLTPKVSYFENLIQKGPAPGRYDVSIGDNFQHKRDPASFFGRSRTNRFSQAAEKTPSPGTYNIPSTIVVKSVKNQETKPVLKKIQAFSLTQRPAGVKDLGSSAPESSESGDLFDTGSADSISELNTMSQGKMQLTSKPLSSPHVIIQKQKISKNKRAIVWKRKHVPPSIPVGKYSFGYQESLEGELVPRKPPKTFVEEKPAFLSSFVEKAKYEGKGYKFAGGVSRDPSKAISDTPGPNVYDPLSADKYLNGKPYTTGPAMMTLAPCRRVTDEIASESLKKAVPGPGAYEIKDSLAEKIKQKRNRIHFGGDKKERSTLNPELLKTPGPGAYYPESSHRAAPQLQKPQPFGSTTKRFQDTTYRENLMPSVGAYDLDQVDSLFTKIKSKANTMSLRPAAFGAIAQRFNYSKKPPQAPGPFSYDVQKVSSFAKKSSEDEKPASHIQKLLHKGPTKVAIGNILVHAAEVHVPIFGSQTERFDKTPGGDVPPPGSYNLEHAFHALQSKGRVESTGLMASKNKREIFKVPEGIPGPSEYYPKVDLHKEIRRKVGAFLSTGPRFTDKHEKLPGPGTYLPADYENGLVRKTFNITLTELHQKRLLGHE